ncbi:putative lipid II flippase FtsW [Gammaproteobacteria bacterium]|nr:putative lipid II flippase FtsW [Gammaproteobacteria bacterium]
MSIMQQRSITDHSNSRPLLRNTSAYYGDSYLLIISMLLIAFGLVMMTSASIEIAESQYGDAFYHLKRQIRFLFIGIVAAITVGMIPIKYWKQSSAILFLCALAFLIAVLMPGIGREVNGSTRWLNLGFMTIQASEPAKLLIVIFIAYVLSENREFICTSWKGFVIPFVMVLLPVILLLKEPDFGAVVVLMIAIFGMMFLAGVKLYHFALLLLLSAGGVAGLILSAPYRLARVKSFVQALSDPFNEDVVFGSGYQLAQALIGFGRGEWFGVGLGNSIQKMYFLPEAHTDFVLAIIAEELGVIAVMVLLGLFLGFILRALMIARKNEETGNFFSAYVAYGIAFLFAGQIIINAAVNVGLAPTKGLTLPFLSSGGSSLITCLVMLALLIRIDIENFYAAMGKSKKPLKTKFNGKVIDNKNDR